MEENDCIYFSDGHAEICYKKANDLVAVTWKDDLDNTQKYQLILSKALVALKQYKAKNWLTDMTIKDKITDDEKKWVKRYLLPNISENDIEKVAFIRWKVKDKLSNEIKSTAIKYNIKLRFFKDKASALQWFDQ